MQLESARPSHKPNQEPPKPQKHTFILGKKKVSADNASDKLNFQKEIQNIIKTSETREYRSTIYDVTGCALDPEAQDSPDEPRIESKSSPQPAKEPAIDFDNQHVLNLDDLQGMDFDGDNFEEEILKRAKQQIQRTAPPKPASAEDHELEIEKTRREEIQQQLNQLDFDHARMFAPETRARRVESEQSHRPKQYLNDHRELIKDEEMLQVEKNILKQSKRFKGVVKHLEQTQSRARKKQQFGRIEEFSMESIRRTFEHEVLQFRADSIEADYFGRSVRDQLQSLETEKTLEEAQRAKLGEVERRLTGAFKSGFALKLKMQILSGQLKKALELWGFKAVKFKIKLIGLLRSKLEAPDAGPGTSGQEEEHVLSYLTQKQLITNGLARARVKRPITPAEIAESITTQIQSLIGRYQGERSRRLYSLWFVVKVWLLDRLMPVDWCGLCSVSFLRECNRRKQELSNAKSADFDMAQAKRELLESMRQCFAIGDSLAMQLVSGSTSQGPVPMASETRLFVRICFLDVVVEMFSGFVKFQLINEFCLASDFLARRLTAVFNAFVQWALAQSALPKHLSSFAKSFFQAIQKELELSLPAQSMDEASEDLPVKNDYEWQCLENFVTLVAGIERVDLVPETCSRFFMENVLYKRVLLLDPTRDRFAKFRFKEVVDRLPNWLQTRHAHCFNYMTGFLV